MKRILTMLFCCTLLSCSDSNGGNVVDTPSDKDRDYSVKWDFKDVSEWKYEHQDTSTVTQWYLEGDSLVIYTRANTRDRQKMRSARNCYSYGMYEWRISVPDVPAGEQASTAGFLYFDDTHEIDFEIGYGNESARKLVGAKDGEVLACMTNQAGPFISNYVAITPGWHTFALQLKNNGGKYDVSWIIDGKVRQTQLLTFGEGYNFYIYCSVENLLFIGDHIPAYDTYAKFDYVTFDGKISK